MRSGTLLLLNPARALSKFAPCAATEGSSLKSLTMAPACPQQLTKTELACLTLVPGWKSCTDHHTRSSCRRGMKKDCKSQLPCPFTQRPARRNSMHKIRALLVDDEPIARLGIRQQLQSEEDVEVIGECANGEEAVAAIRTQAPDLVFLDVQMPLLSGFGVVEEVGVDQLPAVVFVTAYDEHAIRAFEVNALDYLLKPIEPRRFQKTLSRVREQLSQSTDKRLNKKLSALLGLLEKSDSVLGKPYLERVVIKEGERVLMVPVQ